MDRIVVAFPNEEAQRRILRLLESGGYRPAACCATGAEAIRAVHKLGSAVVICGFRLRGMTASDLAADLSESAVVVVIASAANLDFCEGENLHKLATPVPRAAFYSTLDMLQRFEQRSLHHAPPRRGAEDEALIRKAKELLMEVNRMTESEAHRFLQKRSMDAGLKMTETAQLIADSYLHGTLT